MSINRFKYDRTIAIVVLVSLFFFIIQSVVAPSAVYADQQQEETGDIIILEGEAAEIALPGGTTPGSIGIGAHTNDNIAETASGGYILIAGNIPAVHAPIRLTWEFEVEQAGYYDIDYTMAFRGVMNTNYEYYSDVKYAIDAESEADFALLAGWPRSDYGSNSVRNIQYEAESAINYSWFDLLADYKMVEPTYLTTGNHTFELLVYKSNLPQSPARIHFALDVVTLTPAEAPLFAITAMTPVKAVAVYEAQESAEIQLVFNRSTELDRIYHYQVVDVWGDQVEEGTVTVVTGESTHTMMLQAQQPGWYQFKLYEDEERTIEVGEGMAFSVVPPKNERYQGETPFAVDFAGKYLVSDYTRFAGLVDTLPYAGLNWVRERYNWIATEADYASYEDLINKYKEQDIQVLEMYSNAPTAHKDFTGNLFEVYEMQKDIAEHFEGDVSAFEVWNEQDWGFSKTPADNYAAYFKASAIALADADSDVVKTFGGFASGSSSSHYIDLMFQNDVMAYTDLYNFHTHATVSNNNVVNLNFGRVNDHKTTGLAYSDGDVKPLWLTEAGANMPLAERDVPTLGQQLGHARFVATSFVQSIAAGTNKHFWFVYPHYLENNAEWGTFYPGNRSPFPAYSALSALTAELGEGLYKGELKNLPAGVEGHLFHNGSRDVAVLWATSAIQLQLPTNGEVRITDFVGKARTELANGQVTLSVSPYPLFVTFPEGEPFTNYYAAERYVPQGSPVSFEKNEKIVLQQLWDRDSAHVQNMQDAKNDGYVLRPDDVVDVKLAVYNFNDEEVSGTIQGMADDLFLLDETSGALNRMFTIPAKDKVELSFTVSLSEHSYEGATGYIKFDGALADGKPISASVVLAGQADEGRVVEDVVVLEGYNHPANWDFTNCSTTCTLNAEPATEGEGITFNVSFAGGDRWAYPQLAVPDASVFEDSAGLSFEMKGAAASNDVSLNVFVYMMDGRTYTMTASRQYMVPLTTEWQQVNVPWRKLKLFSSPGGVFDTKSFHWADVESISVGGNGTIDNWPAYTIRNLGYYYSDHPADQLLTDTASIAVSGIESGGVYHQGGIPVVKAVLPEDDYAEVYVYLNNGVYDQFTVTGQEINMNLNQLAVGKHSLVVAGKNEMNYAYRVAVDFYVEEALAPVYPVNAAPINPVYETDSGELYLPSGAAGEIRLANQVELSIPAEATDQGSMITIERMQEGERDSPVYRIQGEPAVELKQPAKLTISYDATELGDDVAIYRYDEQQQMWILVGGEGTNSRITATISELGIYAVRAIAVDEAEPEVTLSDIIGHWGEEFIAKAVQAGIITGYEDGTFRPDQAVSRQELIVMLVRALPGETQVTSGSSSSDSSPTIFTDQDKIGVWASNAVRKAVTDGWITGYADGSFRPQADMTRAEMAVVIARAAMLAEDNVVDADTVLFRDDATIPAWARSEVYAAVAEGVLQGVGGDRFAPAGIVTRAQAAAMAVRLTKLL